MQIRSGTQQANLILNSKFKLLDGDNKKRRKGWQKGRKLLCSKSHSPKEARAASKLHRDLVRVYFYFRLSFLFYSSFFFFNSNFHKLLFVSPRLREKTYQDSLSGINSIFFLEQQLKLILSGIKATFLGWLKEPEFHG
jgi:hypothetical protein